MTDITALTILLILLAAIGFLIAPIHTDESVSECLGTLSTLESCRNYQHTNQ